MMQTNVAVPILNELKANDNFCDTVTNIVLKAYGDAWNDYDDDCPQGYVVVRSYHEAAKSLTKALRPSWERETILGAERWNNTTDYSKPIQLAIAHVKSSGAGYCSASKGRASLVFTGQMSLFDDLAVVNKDIEPLWVLVEFTASIIPNVKIVLAKAKIKGRKNSHMAVNDSRVLYDGALNPIAEPIDLPAPVPSSVVLEEIELEEVEMEQ